jgi:hypothetical protein
MPLWLPNLLSVRKKSGNTGLFEKIKAFSRTNPAGKSVAFYRKQECVF